MSIRSPFRSLRGISAAVALLAIGAAGFSDVSDAVDSAPDTWALPKGVAILYYHPTKESWSTGDRTVTCTYSKESGTFTGTLMADAKTLKPEQIAYLKGSNAVYDAFWANQSEKDVEEDLAGYKAQAKA